MGAAVSNQVSIIDGNASRRHRAGRGKSTTSFPSMRARTPSHDPSKEPIPRHRCGTPCLVHFMRPAPLSPLTPMLGPSRRSAGADERCALWGDKHDLLESITAVDGRVSLVQSRSPTRSRLSSIFDQGVSGGETFCGPGRLTWPHIRRHLSRAGVRNEQRWQGSAHGVDQPFSLEPGRRGARRGRVGRLGPDSLVTVNRLPPGGFHRRLTCSMGRFLSCARAECGSLFAVRIRGEMGVSQDWAMGEYFAHVFESFLFSFLSLMFSSGSAMTPKVTVTLKQNDVIRRTEGRGST